MTNKASFAVIGGSRAYDFLSQGYFVGEEVVESTPYGPHQPLFLVQGKSQKFFFMSRHGRRTYELSSPFVPYRANVYVLKELGVKQILSWAGPGSLTKDLQPGQFVVPDDIIDETKRRECTFFQSKGLGFLRQFPVFCPTLRALVLDMLPKSGLPFSGKGTYVCTEGPRLETPAEIRKFRLLGGDMVGMSLAPEVFLARELEICYASICYVCNYAEGVKHAESQPETLFGGLSSPEEMEKVERAVSKFPELIEQIVEQAASVSPKCQCQRSMERYRREGRIGKDWHDWLGA